MCTPKGYTVRKGSKINKSLLVMQTLAIGQHFKKEVQQGGALQDYIGMLKEIGSWVNYNTDVTQNNKNLRSLCESWCAKLCEGATSFVAALRVRQIRTFIRINPNPYCSRWR
jgi:hypothetical protein